MSIHALPKPDDNARLVPFVPEIDPSGDRFQTLRRDPVKPVPEGTYVACIFRVTGYDPDCDGSFMARIEQVDSNGKATGWEATHLGLYSTCEVVLDGPGDLHELIDVQVQDA